MFRKRFYVKIDLQLHAITCPGVWLCTHGYLEATLKTLGYFFRTGAMEPRFPLLCHDRFTMEGYFKSVGSTEELERVLAAEQVEITLWQNGRRLAHFLGKFSDIMHSTMPKLTCFHNVNVQLLMKPSPTFPGIIAPKVELSALVGVQDRLSSVRTTLGNASHDSSKCCSLPRPNWERDCSQRYHRGCQQSEEGCGSCLSYNLEEKRRQKPVCHTRGSRTSHRNPSEPSNGAGKKFEAESQTSKNELRRLSTCSSFLSNISYACSQTSAGSSKCSHSFDSLSTGGNPVEDHQQRCEICQTYKKVFRVHDVS